MKSICVIILFLSFVSFSEGQELMKTCIKHARLSSKFNPADNQVYITFTIIDSLKQVKVYLINNSNTELQAEGHNYHIDFNEEIKDNRGNWSINRLYGAPSRHIQECIRPINEPFKIPSNSYSWRTIPSKELNSGTFNTELRYSCVIDGQIIYSKPQTISLDIEFALPPKYRLDHLTKNGLMDDISTSRKIDLLYFKAKNHFVFRLEEEALKMLESFVIDHPEYYRAHLLLGGLLINKAKDLSGLERVILYSEAINVWEQIPEGNINYPKAKENIKLLSSFLPKKDPFNRIESNNNCEEINGEVYCKTELLSKERIRIRFKDF